MSAVANTPATATAPMSRVEPAYTPSPIAEPFWMRALLIIVALTFMTLFLFVPLVAVFVEAFKKGWQVYLTSITEPDAISAIKLTLLTGFALAFARATGEYGSVIFIAGNMPMVSEITPLFIITKLEQYDYAGATAIAVVMLLVSFLMLLTINLLQAWTRKRGQPEKI